MPSATDGASSMTFDELNLAPADLKAVREQGYESPTPIQAQAIPAVLAGQDLLGGAQTTEPWGVRRFFVRAPDGTVIDMVDHPD